MVFAVCAVSLFAAVAAVAATNKASPTPQPVSLTVPKSAGTILTIENGSRKLKFNLARIEALGTYRVRTSTFWPADNGVYEGVLLADLLRAAGLEGAKSVRVVALDNYSQSIPREDWIRWQIMIATRRDGRPLSRRQKGPLRVVYPRDSDPGLADQAFRLRWVWMIKKIVVARN